MIDQTRVEKKLHERFGAVREVRPGVLRVAENFEDSNYAIRYFDLTGELESVSGKLREYQEDLLAETFFDPQSPTHLRWNHYLYFVAPEGDESGKEAFLRHKEHIESDRTYARKVVLTEAELDKFLDIAKTASIPPIDISTQWTKQLDQNGLSFVLDESISAPEAARLIKAGHTRTLPQPVALAQLSRAESVAGHKFLRTIEITAFRRYPFVKHFEFGDVNLIYGRNGTGKTSLLEAIEYLYCGENRRSSDQESGTKLQGTFVEDDADLVTASSIQLAALRSRNMHWYAKADIRKSTLADSFGKFNFLDTDAAVDLSNNNDSEERLKQDVARLLFGAEAEKLTARLSRVDEKLDQAVATSEKDKDVLEVQIQDARARLDALGKTPQASDSAYADLQATLAMLGWRTLPSSKQVVQDLSNSLQVVAVAAKQLGRDVTDQEGATLTALTEQYREMEGALADAEAKAQRIEKLSMESAVARQEGVALRSRYSNLEAMSRYISAGLYEKNSRLAVLRSRCEASSLRLATLGQVDLDFDAVAMLDTPLSNAQSQLSQHVRDLSNRIKQQSGLIASIEGNMASHRVLQQRILSTAMELLVNADNPDCCPVCQTQFEAGELKRRMHDLEVGQDSDVLSTAQSQLGQMNAELALFGPYESAVNALSIFISGKSELTVRRALESVEEEREGLVLSRREVREIESALEELAANDLTESGLIQLLSEVHIERLPDTDELAALIHACATQIAALVTLSEEREEQLGDVRLQLSELTGVHETSMDVSAELQVQQLRRRLVDVELLVAAARTVESAIDSKLDNAELLLRLEQAVDQASRVALALQTEAHAASASKSETAKMSDLTSQLTDCLTQLKRMNSSSQLMKALLNQARAGTFTKQVLKANANSIAAIFSAIHAPSEFEISADDGDALAIIRSDTTERVTLRQMSTGQRSAYALSLFLSMNRSLTSGPPLVLLDDPIAHIDDLNILSFLDHLREISVSRKRQIFLATADDKLAGLFRQKFRFLGEHFRDIELSRA